MSYSILCEEPVGKVLAVKFVISLKEEIKVCVLLWGCSPPGMRGLWWEGSDDWSAVVMDPGFLKGPGGSSRTAQGFGMGDGSEQCECWAGDCLPQGHHQEDEAFARQLEQALRSQAHIMRNFNILGICQKGITTGRVRSILEFRDGNGQSRAGYWAPGKGRHFAEPQLPRRISWECERWEQTSGVSILRDIQNPFGYSCEQPAAADTVLCWEYCLLIHPVQCSFDSLE